MKDAVVAALGVALLVRGLGRRTIRGWLQALFGGWLLVRAGRRLVSADGGAGSTESGPGPSQHDADAATVSRSITVAASAEDAYEGWRDPDSFARIVDHVADVTERSDDRLHWRVEGPAGRDLTWETRIVEADPGQILRWTTTDDARIGHEGEVRFSSAPGDRGTQVTCSVTMDPPGGALGRSALARLDLLPEALVGEALRRSKRLVETGEVPTLEANPSGRGRGDRL